MIEFTPKHRSMTVEMLGYIPKWLSEYDLRSARDQLNTGYSHGGGWDPFQSGNVSTPGSGFVFLENGNLKYPGDPQTRLLAEAKLRNEVIRIYEQAWVAIIQEDGSYEICRMD